LSIEEALDS